MCSSSQGGKEMENTRWIQLSDLHILFHSPAWENFKKAFFEFLDLNTLEKKDFIIFSGDYRNIQNKEPFDQAQSFILEIKQKLGFSDDNIFVVPGNHDTDSKYGETDSRTDQMKKLLPSSVNPWERINDEIVVQKLKECAEEPQDYIDRICHIRRTENENPNAVFWDPLLAGFSAFQRMAEALIPWYTRDNHSPVIPHLRIWKAGDAEKAIGAINIIHLNSAVVADGCRAHFQAIDLNKATRAFNNATNNPSIVVAHNSFYDLHPKIQKELKPMLAKARTFCWLCGDIHKFEEFSISCPVKMGSYSIPIFVCGKTAPDHSDNYSEVGFICFETDGKSLLSQRIVWDGERLDIKPKEEKKLANPEIADTPSKTLRIGYLSCTPGKKPSEKYHLGHAYFIHLLDEWKKNDQLLLLTSSYIFDHNRSSDTLKAQVHYSEELIIRWENCFGNDIKVIDIKEYLQIENHFDSTEEKLYNYIGEVEMVLERNTTWYDFVEAWYKKGRVDEGAYEQIMRLMGNTGSDDSFSKEEALSFAYLLLKRPTWYSGNWIVNFLRFWNSQLPDILDEVFGKKHGITDIVIVESKRNRYVCEAIWL